MRIQMLAIFKRFAPGLIALILAALPLAAQNTPPGGVPSAGDMSVNGLRSSNVLGIWGHVTDTQGKPVAGLRLVMVRTGLERAVLVVGTTQAVHRNGKRKVKNLGQWTAKTKKKGIYGRYGMPLGIYTIHIYQGKRQIGILRNGRPEGGYNGGPMLVNIHLRKLGGVSQVQNAAPAAQAANPNDDLARGQKLILAGHLHQAAAAFAAAAKINPAQAGIAYYDEAVLLFQAHHLRAAGAAFLQSAAAPPHNPQAWLGAGMAFSDAAQKGGAARAQDVRQARAALQHYLKLQPQGSGASIALKMLAGLKS